MWTRLVATYIQEESAPKKEVEVEDEDADTNAVAVDGDQRHNVAVFVNLGASLRY